MRHLAAALLLALPQVALAQSWVTPEVCAVETPHIAPEIFEPPGLATLEAAAANIPNGTGRLWQITSPEGAVSHLWGTMHSSSRHILDVPDQVMDRLLDARILAVEIDYRHRDRASYEYWLYWEGVFDYDSLLPPLDFNIDGADGQIAGWIVDRLVAQAINPEDIAFLTPGGLAELLLGDPCEDFNVGIPPIQDDYLLTRAHVAGIPVRGLEGALDFRNHLNDPDNRETAKALISVYGAYLMPVQSSAERAASFALYLEGRIGLMMAWDTSFLRWMLGPNADDAIALANGYLIDARNRIFVASAMDDLTEGGAFIAVGAFHLPGENGMVALLRNDGFTVTRVPVPGEAP